MGSDKRRDPQASDNELPQHEVTLPAYSISRYPVTNAQYVAFVTGAGYQERRYWTEAGWQWKEDRTGPETYGGVFDLPSHPVVVVTWYEAVAFCRWLTEQLRQGGEIGEDEEITLPAESQWEKAARGGKQIPSSKSQSPKWVENPNPGRVFPWGGARFPVGGGAGPEPGELRRYGHWYDERGGVLSRRGRSLWGGGSERERMGMVPDEVAGELRGLPGRQRFGR
jgi:formylglycine-generating enzyme required for sulfatase activity